MKILVLEYITGGGLAREDLPPALATEGDMMLYALLSDLAELNDMRTTICRDARLHAIGLPCEVHIVDQHDDFGAAVARASIDVDAVWPIAPETGGVLCSLSEQVLQLGKILLGSRPEGVRIAASKRDTIERLAAHGLPVAPVFEPHPALFDGHPAWVLKPDDGVGCSGARICRCAEDLLQVVDAQPAGSVPIAQPFVHGTSISLSILCRDGRASLLCGNRQRVAIVNDEFRLLGCVANDPEVSRAITSELVDRVAAAIPGLWGYVGIDLMMTADGPKILEVNPRITLSYVGLRRALGINPARMVIDLLHPGCGSIAPVPVGPTMMSAVEIDVEPGLHGGH